MAADIQQPFGGNSVVGGPNSFQSAAKIAMLQQSMLRNRMPAGPIFTNTGLTTEELLAAKKPFTRKSVDYNASMINMVENRIWQRDYRDRPLLQPDPGYIPLMTPTMDYPENSANAVATKFVRTAMNKMKCPVFCITWTPNGRRLLTGSSSGEFTLWNGLQFNFETILQAHDAPIRAMTWSNSGLWLLSGDHSGFIKYWQTNMNNVKMYQAHREVIRDICFSPTDNKFASCSDDATVRIWDFYTGIEERILRGHGADCKTVHWHPTLGLLVSGSKDAQQPIKIWDPKSGRSLNTLFPHKAAVTCCRFSPNGRWMVSSSRDHMMKLFDIRNMKNEMNTLRGHKREVLCLNWHPLYSQMLVSGGGDGSILYWDISLDKQVGGVDGAHEGLIWDIKWHPLGHITASASNDFATKFWTRNNPGDRMRDRYNLNLDEDLEAEDMVANQEPIHDTLNSDNPEMEYQEVDTSIPALNPEETSKIPKKDRKRYIPPQFSTDSLGMGLEKLKRGEKRIDPKFKVMWSNYQRPDLIREDLEERNENDAQKFNKSSTAPPSEKMARFGDRYDEENYRSLPPWEQRNRERDREHHRGDHDRKPFNEFDQQHQRYPPHNTKQNYHNRPPHQDNYNESNGYHHQRHGPPPAAGGAYYKEEENFRQRDMDFRDNHRAGPPMQNNIRPSPLPPRHGPHQGEQQHGPPQNFDRFAPPQRGDRVGHPPIGDEYHGPPQRSDHYRVPKDERGPPNLGDRHGAPHWDRHDPSSNEPRFPPGPNRHDLPLTTDHRGPPPNMDRYGPHHNWDRRGHPADDRGPPQNNDRYGHGPVAERYAPPHRDDRNAPPPHVDRHGPPISGQRPPAQTSDFDYRNSTGPPSHHEGPPPVKNEDTFLDEAISQARFNSVNPVPSNPEDGAMGRGAPPKPHGPSGRGGLNWYS